MRRGGKLAFLLRPLATIYGLIVALRNFLFDRGLLKEYDYHVPIICVGNISVGGTGKTPHVEYVLRRLSKSYRVAVVSRGYKRKSKGMQVASPSATSREIGDEPWQIKNKYPHVMVVVDAKRRRAINYLLALPEEERPQVIVLDDGYQHRYVKPSFSILLSDFSNPISEDHLLPYGDLREFASARYRADCLVVTKCPEDMAPIDIRIAQRTLSLYPHQKVFFTGITYRPLRPLQGLASPEDKELDMLIPSESRVIVVAALARPEAMIEELGKRYTLCRKILFGDHHLFSASDIEKIYEAWKQENQEGETYVICSEKDATRLLYQQEQLPPALGAHILYLPIEVSVRSNKEEFDRMIELAARALPRRLQ